MKKFLFTCSIAAALLTLLLISLPTKLGEREGVPSTPLAISQQPTATIRDKTFVVEIADSPQERSAGLSNRPSLPENAGMLFVFENVGLHTFWMKDTLIPLDMLFIRDGKIVTIHKNVPVQSAETPDAQLPDYAPEAPVNYVLEINAGLSDTYGFTKGDTVEIKGVR